MKLTWKTVSPYTGREIEEDAPGNSAGGGNVAGIGVGPKGAPGFTPKKKKKKDLYDGRTRAYREHRKKLESARLRRQEVIAKKKSGFIEQIVEATKWKKGDGRPRGGAYIENERFWDLDNEALWYIMKDADAAMKANPTGRKAGKYADEVNDAHTVLGWRKKNGITVK